MITTEKAIEIGAKIGTAMYRDHKADCLPVGFCLDDRDGDILTSLEIFQGSQEWHQAVGAAKDAYAAAAAKDRTDA